MSADSSSFCYCEQCYARLPWTWALAFRDKTSSGAYGPFCHSCASIYVPVYTLHRATEVLL